MRTEQHIDRREERARQPTHDLTLTKGDPRTATDTRTLWAGALVALAAMLLTLIFVLNTPQPFIPFHDTQEYVHRADIILSGGAWVDGMRMPGYPLLLALAFAISGKDNYAAAAALEALLFIVTSIEVYGLAFRIWRDIRLATLVGLLFSANVYFYSFFRAILSDGTGAALVVGLALAMVYFLERPDAGRFWLVAALSVAVLMTRPEWALAPLVAFPYLALASWRSGAGRALLAHMGLALALIYGIVVGYMALNGYVNGYFGLTDTANINLYGKITQYGMQGQAPANYAHISAATEVFTRRGLIDPWSIYWRNRALAGHNFTHMGAYARAIILSHPVEYMQRSIPVAFNSLSNHYLFGGYSRTGPIAGVVGAMEAFSAVVYPLFMLFPVGAVAWLVSAAHGWMRPSASHGARRLQVEALGALSLLALYGLVVTTLTTYSEYARLHLAFDPLMLLVVIGGFTWLIGAERNGERDPTSRVTSAR